MRPFEIAMALLGLGWTGWFMTGRRQGRIDVAFALTSLTAMAVHTSEGARAQMVPIYSALAALMMVSALRAARRESAPSWTRPARLAAGAVALTLIVSGAIVASTFPVFHYEDPRGPYGIGTTTYVLEGGPQNRPLVVQAWYPAEPGQSGDRARITTHPALLETAYAMFTGLPEPLFDNLRLIRTHAILDAPFAAPGKRFPVVLFSHGPLGANRSQSVFQMEALASAGFVTIAIDHTGYASTTIFPDGHAVPAGANAAWPVFVDDRSTAMLNTWVKDVSFVLDRLADLDAHDRRNILTNRLNLARVGYVGASFGGSVVVQALLDEARITAGVAEDGKPFFSPRTLTDLKRPLLYMQSEVPYIKSTDTQLARWGLTNARFRAAEQDHYARQMELFGHARGPIYNVYIRRTNHVTFSDLNLIVHIPDLHLMPIRRAHRIINDYTVAFFDRYLNDQEDPLVDGQSPSPYEEVTVASRNIPSTLLVRTR